MLKRNVHTLYFIDLCVESLANKELRQNTRYKATLFTKIQKYIGYGSIYIICLSSLLVHYYFLIYILGWFIKQLISA